MQQHDRKELLEKNYCQDDFIMAETLALQVDNSLPVTH